MTHEATRLAACPFCGAKSSQLIEDLIICYVECAECSVTGPARADADAAIEAWNRRAALAQPAPTAEVALPAVSEEADFEVHVQYDEDSMGVASTSGPRDRALAEAMNYARQYLEEGPVEVFEVVRTSIAKLEFRAQSAAKGDAGHA